MKSKKLFLMLFAALLLIALCSCTTEASLPLEGSTPVTDEGTAQATVVITRDFGTRLLVEKTVTLEGDMTALDALQQVTEVETKYGGGFINAINGISSNGSNGSKEDWFFYVNGISVKTGAGDYSLHDGDIEQWDFRNWGFRQFIPALAGDFPEPLRHGYGGISYPSIVVYQEGWQEAVGQLADGLRQFGISDVTTSDVTELPAEAKESANLILLGTGNHPLIAEINQAWDRLGFYMHFQEDHLEVYNAAGNLVTENDATSGIIQTTQSPWNPKGTGACENVVWIISGTDEAGVAAAVDILINHHNDFRYAYSVLINNGELSKVPE